MPRKYVDNAMNRQLGRVGLPVGSAVHSKSSSGYGSSSSSNYSSSSSRGTYVDNTMNRSLGRVGMEYGTAVHSRSSDSSSSSGRGTYADNAMNRSLGRVGMDYGTAVHSRSSGSNSSSTSSSSSKGTYVDNAMNRSLGRVGMEYGTAVHSRSSDSSSSSSRGTYVDNAMNRSLGRVGMDYGTAVHSRSSDSSSSSSKGTYVDNAVNRNLGRVGMQYGTAVHSRSNSSSNSIDSSSRGVYKDNPLNRKLGRVGKPLGSMPYSKKNPILGNATESQNALPAVKTYVDNAFNRKHNRVGLPLGSKPISRMKNTTIGQLDKFEKPKRQTDCRKRLAAAEKYLEENSDEDLPAEFDDIPEDDISHILESRQRQEMIERFLEESARMQEYRPYEYTPTEIIKKYKGKIIDFSVLEIGKIIGHGGFGEVYFAFLNGEAVAVKKLKCQQLTKKRLELFIKEMEVFLELEHDNIVRFLGACTKIPNLAIVMELMDTCLYDALHIKPADFSDDDRLEILKGITKGMSYLHYENVAHCDLKTQNVLLINVPGKQYYDDTLPIRAKISDFGLSKIKSDTATSSSVAGAHIGTPRYSAPEVHRGEILTLEQLKKADMFSLGLVIWELAVEEIPYEDLNLQQLIAHVGQKGEKPQSTGNLKLGRKLQASVYQCWSMDPEERPTAVDMASIAADLEDILENVEE